LVKGEVVHHIDGNKRNNHPDNLEVISQSDHIKEHIYGDLKNLKIVRGEESVLAKLTEESVVAIRSMMDSGKSAKSVGDMFGVSASNIRLIWARKTWRHLP